jgi:lipid II:glycine glycyltransferase (peptidoglycan interpeptide bridge formation enzyme)
MVFEIYSMKNKEKWKEKFYLFNNEKIDIYYLPEYYETWSQEEKAEPICIYAEVGESVFLYPFFKKNIENYKLEGDYYDIFSAYGYGGVVSDIKNKNDITIFNNKFNNWCKENNIIAEFIRENPSINTRDNFVRDVDYIKVRRNVYLKATNDYRVPSKSRRTYIKSALKNKLSVDIDENLETIDEFIKLYSVTAERLSMDESYLFSKEYFFNHLIHFSKNTKIINIFHGNIIIASALFYYGFGKTIYHLGASDFGFKKLYPNELLISGMIEESKKIQNSTLSLGGGVTNKNNDNLFEYKRKFGSDIRDVYIGKKIHNENIYKNLCEQWEEKFPYAVDKYKNIFLKYRYSK